MTLRKITLFASIAFIGYAGTNCSSKEDKTQYDKFYGKGRAEREETAGSGNFIPRSDDERKVDPATINSLSVTENADTEIAAGDETSDAQPELAGKTVEEVTKKKEEAPTKTDVAPQQKPIPADIAALLNKNTCSACHKPYDRLVGPAYSEVAKKNYSVAQIVELVYKPKPENWPGYPPMMAMAQVPKAEVEKIGKWINSL